MSEIYEDPIILSEYLLFHYGSREEVLPPDIEWPAGMVAALDFAVRTTLHFSDRPAARGLDLGCAVGRSAFEMSRNCKHVLGLDFSHSFIDAANTLREMNSIDYSRRDEAHLKTKLTARLPEGVDPSRVVFLQGDAMQLPSDLGKFDQVHAANLICRLPDPVLLLECLADLLNSGGELVLATPCTWLEGFTPSKKWPDGDTFAWLQKHLAGDFELVKRTDEPFLIRETARKFQWTRSMLTLWCKR